MVGRRVLRAFALALLVYLAVAWFKRGGHSPWSLGLAGALLVLLTCGLGYSLLRSWRARREALWERAIYEPALREQAIRQLKRARAARTPVTHKTRSEHARLSVLLAELYDAQNAYADATATIDAVELATLPALDRGLVRHTRAVTHLRAGDAQGALTALQGRDASGDSELDQRLALLEAYARVELGDFQFGLDEAEKLTTRSDVHESVQAEARVVRAAALDAAGRREEALVTMISLGRETLRPLSELGQPRARLLAKLALDSSAA